MEPPAAFSVPASGARLRHPRPAPIGDLNPDNVVRHLDRGHDRLARSTRAAVPQTIGESSPTSSAATSPHGWPEPSSPSANARASRARPARPASVTVSRARPAISAPAFPAARAPGNHAGRRADTAGCTLDSAANVKPGTPPERAPEPRQAATHTAPWRPDSRPLCASVDAATQRPTALQGDTPRTEKKRPASTRIRS